MDFFKAAAGTLLACLMCAGAGIAVSADEASAETISAGGQTFEVRYADASQDAGYLKYKHRQVEKALEKRSPAGMVQSHLNEATAYGTHLTHDSRFNGLDRSFGIDVSQWQSTIDWKKVKNDGIDYAIIRLGVRGYGSAGTLMIDDRYYENIKGAKAAGLDVGVYFYTQAINVKEAQEEADFCAAALKGYDLELPVYFDIESVDWDRGRLDSAGLSVKQKTDLCKAFCDRIETYGYQSGVYANYNWLTHYIDGPSLGNDYKIWIAAYGSYINYSGIYDIWQYGSDGYVDGIKGNVDTNVMYKVDFSPQTKLNASITDGVISWNAATGADGYTVYGTNDGKTSYAISDVKGTSFDLDGQEAQQYSVAAYNYYGGKKYYGKSSSLVDGFNGQAKELTAERAGIDKVRLNWSAVDKAVGYDVYKVKDGKMSYVGNTGGTSFVISGNNLGEYTAVVRAYNKNGMNGDYSEEIVLPGNAPSYAPRVERSANKLFWTEVENADGYVVTFTDQYGSEEFFVEDTNFTLMNNSTGKYYVQAYTELDGRTFRSSSSNVCEFSGVNYPPQGELILDSDDEGLEWNKIPDALGYVVYKVTEDGKEEEVAEVDSCRYAADDLAGSVYFVKGYNVRKGERFYTEASNRVTVSLTEVTEAKLDNLTEDFAVISWNSIEGCDEYMVYLDRGRGYELYTTVKGSMAVIGGIRNAEFASVRIKGYVSNEDVVRYGLFSNQVYIIGDEDSRPTEEVFSFEDILGR